MNGEASVCPRFCIRRHEATPDPADGSSDCYSVCRLVLGQNNGRLLAALVAQVAAAAKAESKHFRKGSWKARAIGWK
jgi:hypothetical protein